MIRAWLAAVVGAISRTWRACVDGKRLDDEVIATARRVAKGYEMHDEPRVWFSKGGGTISVPLSEAPPLDPLPDLGPAYNCRCMILPGEMLVPLDRATWPQIERYKPTTSDQRQCRIAKEELAALESEE
jgi:hypothetical protein